MPSIIDPAMSNGCGGEASCKLERVLRAESSNIERAGTDTDRINSAIL